jgi:hypothetical protein
MKEHQTGKKNEIQSKTNPVYYHLSCHNNYRIYRSEFLHGFASLYISLGFVGELRSLISLNKSGRVLI